MTLHSRPKIDRLRPDCSIEVIVSRRRRHFNYCGVTEARPIVAVRRMALRGQSLLLWSVLRGCAGELRGSWRDHRTRPRRHQRPRYRRQRRQRWRAAAPARRSAAPSARTSPPISRTAARAATPAARARPARRASACAARACSRATARCIPSDASHCGGCSNKCAPAAGVQQQLLSVELRRRRDPVLGRRLRRHDEQRAQLRRVRQRVSGRLGLQRRRVRLLRGRPDAVLERVRRHDDQQRALRRLQPGLQRHVHERRVRQHAGRHGAAAAEHPAHDQRRVRRLGAGAARHDA